MPLSHSKTDSRGAKKKRQSKHPKGAKAPGGRPRGGGGAGGKGGKGGKEQPYFLRPVTGGGVGVFRRPVGNRAEATTCGVMPSRRMADALVAQLKRAESVVSDLFLEATDDGIEALEAVLAACRDAVLRQGEARQARQSQPARAVADDAGSDDRRPRRGRRRRGRGPRRPSDGPESQDDAGAE